MSSPGKPFWKMAIVACGCLLGLSSVAASAARAGEIVWTAPLDTLTGQCTVTNASDRDLHVVITMLDRNGRAENPAAPVPAIIRVSTGELVRDDAGFPITSLDVVLPPGGAEGIRREKVPAGALEPPTSCRVEAERRQAARVAYCGLLEPDRVLGICVQAP